MISFPSRGWAPDISLRSLRVWQRDGDVFLQSWFTEIGPIFLEPLLVLAIMGMGLGFYVGPIEGQPYLKFIAPGIIGAWSMFGAVFEATFGSYMRMEVRRLYDAMIATPLTVEDVIAGEILWAATRTFLSAAVILLVITLFGLVDSPLALFVLPLSFVAGLTFASIAMLFTALARSISTFNHFFTLFITPMFFFGGVFFPLDKLPALAKGIAWVFPLTAYVDITRKLVGGHPDLEMAWAFLYMLALIALCFPAAVLAMRKRLIR